MLRTTVGQLWLLHKNGSVRYVNLEPYDIYRVRSDDEWLTLRLLAVEAGLSEEDVWRRMAEKIYSMAFLARAY
jgi:hypothetical protein